MAGTAPRQSRGPYRWFVCVPDLTPVPDLRSKCPQRAKHTAAPAGYVAWHEWAEKKSRTHHQVRCPGCDLFAIWVRS